MKKIIKSILVGYAVLVTIACAPIQRSHDTARTLRQPTARAAVPIARTYSWRDHSYHHGKLPQSGPSAHGFGQLIAPTALDWVNVQFYGAKCDAVTDDGPAFNAAMAVWVAGKRGNVLYVPPRRSDGSLCRYLISTPVVVDAGSGSSDGLYEIRFDGAVVLPNVGTAGTNSTVANNIAFKFTNFNSLVIRQLQAYGVYPGFNAVVGNDGVTAIGPNCDIFIEADGTAIHFYDSSIEGIVTGPDSGQPNYLSPRAAIAMLHSSITWQNMRMAATGGNNVIFADDWVAIAGDVSEYFDFYDFDGLPPFAPAGPTQVLLIGNPHDALAFSDRTVNIRNWMSDEGAGLAILARSTLYPAGNRIHDLVVDGFNILQNAGAGYAFEFVNTDQVTLAHGYIQRARKLFDSVGVRSLTFDSMVIDDDAVPGADSDGGLVTCRNCLRAGGAAWGQALASSGATTVIVDQLGARSLPHQPNPRSLATDTSVVVGAPYVDDATGKIIRSDGAAWKDAMGGAP